MDQSVGDGEWASSAPNLMKNLSILLPDQVELAKILLNEGQGHLFHHWKRPGINDERKKSFFDQVRILNGSYPGGLLSYIRNSISLLADSKAGKNPYDSFVPSVPSGEVVTFGDDNFLMLEKIGIEEARRATFVLVAGGLGERLEYKGIKVIFCSNTYNSQNRRNHPVHFIYLFTQRTNTSF
ncbi:hypothetical protein ZOSMA_8G00450 [Zostera marina]|uniref:UDP-sugar pyrophosphorylase n=1 Tax=Zostera marina TaxID=29655 RepID=A0A0K9NJF3_ZOSMR|nr:hypothetical protein ZOSMA_8G00450 [Zostera marina]